MENVISIKKGIGVDIDETLSMTREHWIKELQRLFGNPENLSAEQVIEKYEYTQNVPYWQSEEALNWMENKRISNNFHEELPVIENANHILNKISKIVPVSAYITIRPEVVRDGTTKWLKKHGFPEAPIILKPDDVPFEEGNKWKAKTIKDLHPNLIGFIDDNPNLVGLLSDYNGSIFFYNKNKRSLNPNTIQCEDWNSIYNEVKKKFTKKKEEFKDD